MQIAFDFTAVAAPATPTTTMPAPADLSVGSATTEPDLSAEAAATAATATGETATDAVLHLVLPRAERLASLAYVAWPVEGVSVDDLTNDLVLAVLDALPFAPGLDTPAFNVWVSSTLMTTTYRRYTAAKAEARAYADSMRELAGVSTAAWDDEDEMVEDRIPTARPPRPSSLTLQHVLSALDGDDARLLQWRAAGQTWERLAQRLGVSPRTVRRRHAAALEQARRIAHGAPQDWAVTQHAA
jgi:hypothetical protein